MIVRNLVWYAYVWNECWFQRYAN